MTESNSKPLIRNLVRADLPVLVKLCRAHMDYEQASTASTLLDESQLASLLFGDESAMQCLVVEWASVVVGYATFCVQHSTWRASRYLYVDCLFLDETVRGRGFGAAVMDRIQAEAVGCGCQHIEWQTPSDNEAAIEFYRRLGAEPKAKERFTWEAHESSCSEAIPNSSEPLSLALPTQQTEPYKIRPTRMSGIRDCCGWQLKVYEITLEGRAVEPAIVDAALAFFSANAVWPDDQTDRYGFAMLHVGEHAVWALLHVWSNDILRQFIYCAPLDEPQKFQQSPLPGFNSCVWELEVTRHERDAWVRHVMQTPQSPRFEQYLHDSLEIA